MEPGGTRTCPVELVDIEGGASLEKVLEIVADASDRQIESRSQPFQTRCVHERSDGAGRDQDVRLAAYEVKADTELASIRKLELQGQVQGLWAQPLVGILAADELETVDEVVRK